MEVPFGRISPNSFKSLENFPSDEVGLALLGVLINCKSPCHEINQSCFLQYFDMSQCYVMYVEAALSL